MRERLELDSDELDIVMGGRQTWDRLKRQWKTATADCGAPFPTDTEIDEENWNPWRFALREQLENASTSQINHYFGERFFDGRAATACLACDPDNAEA